MLRFWKQLHLLYDRLLMVILSFFLLIALWGVYDNYYIFSHTMTSSKLIQWKPGQATSVAPEDSPILDDMVAWISIDRTDIDYPVMQASDNIKFLNTDPLGGYSMAGSIFLDCRNSGDFTDDYSLIYGHHMERGRMFGALDAFLDEEYLRQHSLGELIIGKDASKTYRLYVFASMSTSARDDSVFTPNRADIKQTIRSRAPVFVSDQDAKIVALSTCTDATTVNRIIVFCYLFDS